MLLAKKQVEIGLGKLVLTVYTLDQSESLKDKLVNTFYFVVMSHVSLFNILLPYIILLLLLVFVVEMVV